MSRRTVEEYLQTPYWIIDILPWQVPENSDGQIFAIEKYWRSEPRRAAVKQKQISLILKLNCYRSISLDEGKTLNPSPDRIAEAVETERAVILLDDAMIIAEPDDHYMTLYDPDEPLLNLIRTLAAGEGLYVWSRQNAGLMSGLPARSGSMAANSFVVRKTNTNAYGPAILESSKMKEDGENDRSYDG